MIQCLKVYYYNKTAPFYIWSVTPSFHSWSVQIFQQNFGTCILLLCLHQVPSYSTSCTCSERVHNVCDSQAQKYTSMHDSCMDIAMRAQLILDATITIQYKHHWHWALSRVPFSSYFCDEQALLLPGTGIYTVYFTGQWVLLLPFRNYILCGIAPPWICICSLLKFATKHFVPLLSEILK